MPPKLIVAWAEDKGYKVRKGLTGYSFTKGETVVKITAGRDGKFSGVELGKLYEGMKRPADMPGAGSIPVRTGNALKLWTKLGMDVKGDPQRNNEPMLVTPAGKVAFRFNTTMETLETDIVGSVAARCVAMLTAPGSPEGANEMSDILRRELALAKEHEIPTANCLDVDALVTEARSMSAENGFRYTTFVKEGKLKELDKFVDGDQADNKKVIVSRTDYKLSAGNAGPDAGIGRLGQVYSIYVDGQTRTVRVYEVAYSTGTTARIPYAGVREVASVLGSTGEPRAEAKAREFITQIIGPERDFTGKPPKERADYEKWAAEH